MLAGAAITFTDTGEHQLKGKAAPVRLWAAGSVVAEVGGGQRVDGLEAPFTGPGRRPAAGQGAVPRHRGDASAPTGGARRRGRGGQVPVGLGVREVRRRAGGHIRWHRGRCLSYGDGVAFWALAEALRTRFGLLEADTGDVVAERLDAGLAELVPDVADRDWLRPRLAVLLGAGGTGAFAREDLFTAWTAFLEHLAEGQSAVVLVIDDAQHADDSLLDFLDHLLATAQAPDLRLGPGPARTPEPSPGTGWSAGDRGALGPARRRGHGPSGRRARRRPARRFP